MAEFADFPGGGASGALAAKSANDRPALLLCFTTVVNRFESSVSPFIMISSSSSNKANLLTFFCLFELSPDPAEEYDSDLDRRFSAGGGG
jgi:hypothetical protein